MNQVPRWESEIKNKYNSLMNHVPIGIENKKKKIIYLFLENRVKLF